MIKKLYKATEGLFSQKKAQVYGECLDKISQKKSGRLKAIDVVDEARNTRNPLHNYFEWNNSKAGEKYRLHQARMLINHIVVTIKYDHTEKEQKAFFSINETPFGKTKNKTYVPVEIVMAEPNFRNQVLQRAVNEVVYWEEQYKEYNELGKIFRAIDETKKRLHKKLKNKRR